MNYIKNVRKKLNLNFFEASPGNEQFRRVQTTGKGRLEASMTLPEDKLLPTNYLNP